VDDRLIAPESHAEMLDGRMYRTMGANQPHGTRHFEATGLFFGALAAGYAGAVDMLTRADEDSDAAPDLSVFPAVPDPKTGGRQLEEIAVEVLDTERMSHATDKVEKFAARGVRRLFAIRVAARKVYEWDHAHHDWTELAEDAVITDRCFRVPVPVKALVDRVLADDTVARALIARGNRVLVEALALGTPVVSTDCPGGPREILHDGAYGPLVPVGDAVALSRAMARMLDQPTAAGLLREAAQSYSVEACVARYLRLLEGLPDSTNIVVGNQIGKGTTRDIATVLGAVGGAYAEKKDRKKTKPHNMKKLKKKQE